MNTKNEAAPAEEGRDFLVIYSGLGKPDEAALRQLLEEAKCKIDELMILSTAEIAAENIDPCDFDVVITLLDDALAVDGDLEKIIFSAVQGDCPIIGVWRSGQSSENIHPVIAKYGRSQIPWNAEHVASALGTHCLKPYQTPSGGQSAHHKIKYNKC